VGPDRWLASSATNSPYAVRQAYVRCVHQETVCPSADMRVYTGSIHSATEWRNENVLVPAGMKYLLPEKFHTGSLWSDANNLG